MTHLFSQLFTTLIVQQVILTLISEWAFKWKMAFNPDPTKQAQKKSFFSKYDPVNPVPCLSKSFVAETPWYDFR